MRRGSSASIVANPVLVGAVTVLVVTVAVFLAYNANNGLPFVPTRALNVQVDNGAELVPGNEVRAGGYRIGVVDDMLPRRLPNGKVGAILRLKLDKKLGPLPVDSTVVIRPKSTLGLKYVELHKGVSRDTIPDGGTLGVAHTRVPVELDEFYNMFDAPTRAASRANLKGFGNAFAGRGYDLNVTIQSLPRLFTGLQDVMANLADPRTELPNFFRQLGNAARVVAPISKIDARVFTEAADTFAAISRDPQALKDTIAKSPATLDVSTRSLRVQRPFLAETAKFSHDLRFAAADLAGALPDVNAALETGTPVQRRSVELDTNLQGAMGALRDLALAPTTNGALRGLTATVGTLQPQLRYLGPYVTVCNYWTMFWDFTAEHFTAPDATGGAERALLNQANGDPDSVTSQGANEFVHGVPASTPVQHGQNGGVPQYLHNNTSGGDAIHADGTAKCIKGQQGYVYGLNRFRPGGAGYDAYRRAAVDQPLEDPKVTFGPTFAHFDKQGRGVGTGPTRVPAGETFTAEPGGTALKVPAGGLPNQVAKP
jgi:virulence factor Mce-like protein